MNSLAVLITVLVAIGGAYSYAKSRLDKLIAQLDEIRIWLYYPALRTIPLRATYTKADGLEGIAKYSVDKLVEARAAIAGRLPGGIVPLMIEGSGKENVNTVKGIDDMITLLHEFSVTQFTSAEKLNEQWKTIFDDALHLYNAVTALENRYFNMRHWLPRWLSNLCARAVTRLRNP